MAKFKKFLAPAKEHHKTPSASSGSDTDSSSSYSVDDVKPTVARISRVSGQNESNTAVEEFVKKNLSGFTISSVSEQFKLDDNDEVFLLQLPKNFAVKSLIGKKVNLQKKSKINTDDGHTFELQQSSQNPRQRLLTRIDGSDIHLVPFEAKGVLVLRETFHTDAAVQADEEEKYLREFQTKQDAPLEVPTDLRTRHPLLGADYVQELSSRQHNLLLMEQIKKEKDKLDSPKKRKRKRDEEEPVEGDRDGGVSPEKKKKKKQKSIADTSEELQWLKNI